MGKFVIPGLMSWIDFFIFIKIETKLGSMTLPTFLSSLDVIKTPGCCGSTKLVCFAAHIQLLANPIQL